jgi:hypothetical protein
MYLLMYVCPHVLAGTWDSGRTHGKGHAVFSNGDRYVGEFQHGSAGGYGILFGSKEEKYEVCHRTCLLLYVCVCVCVY